METNVNNLIIGNKYVCQCIYPSIPVKLLKITKIENLSGLTFIYTNMSEYTYQVYPQKLVICYTEDEYKKISNISMQNNYPIKLVPSNTICPISLDVIQDDDEIIIIQGTEHVIFLRDQLEKCFETKKISPLTGLPINNAQLKYYTAIIFNCDEDLFFY